MKYIYMILSIALCFFIYSDISFPNGGTLPKDGNAISMQIGRSMRMYDDDITNLDHMYNGTFADTTKWDLTDSLSIAGGKLVYTETDTSATVSTATMAGDSLLVAVRDSQVLRFYYDVIVDSAVVGGVVIAWIDGLCDSTALSLVAGTSKYVTVTTGLTGSDSSFVFNIQPDTLVTRADFSFDNFKLTSYYTSPVAIANTASVTLSVPDDTIELIIDSNETDIQLTVGEAYYLVDTPITIPILEVDTLKIYNGSGGAASVSFYFLNL